MNNRSGALVMLGGIVITSVMTYILTRAKYEKTFGRRSVTLQNKNEEKQQEVILQPAVSKEKASVTSYAEKYNKEYAKKVQAYVSNPDPAPVREFIDEDIFEMNDDFEKIGFTLYADNVLADENDAMIVDRENNVGDEAIENFDEHEINGAVYIRNYETKTDFEILRDLRNYSDVIRSKPHAKIR